MKRRFTGMVALAVAVSAIVGCSSKKEPVLPTASPSEMARPNDAYQQRIIREIGRKVDTAKREGSQLGLITEMLCRYGQQPEYSLVNAQLPILYDRTKTALWPKTPREAMARKCPEVLAG